MATAKTKQPAAAAAAVPAARDADLLPLDPAERIGSQMLQKSESALKLALAHSDSPKDYEIWRLQALRHLYQLAQRYPQMQTTTQQAAEIRSALTECAHYGLILGRHCTMMGWPNARKGGLIEVKLHWTRDGVRDFLAHKGVEIDPPEFVHAHDTFRRQLRVKDGKRDLDIEHGVNDFGDRGPRVGAYVTWRCLDEEGAYGPTQFLGRNAEYFARIAKDRQKSAWGGPFGEQMWLVNLVRQVRKWVALDMPHLPFGDGYDEDEAADGPGPGDADGSAGAQVGVVAAPAAQIVPFKDLPPPAAAPPQGQEPPPLPQTVPPPAAPPASAPPPPTFGPASGKPAAAAPDPAADPRPDPAPEPPAETRAEPPPAAQPDPPAPPDPPALDPSLFR